ncbi:hypothetical protein [Pseudoalteromonas luteoviolacea]|uniref:Uncharacterized protein n=1 Tax=Pseudoalteromonas luteoviolacea S4054 TaxID=1129367 RepID=A0A0F6AIS6_9GAMM|nr:hypothetical protein [Pseudoalteromonas luteoviolacea]AOT06984.1 hypothetical protein S4054249_03420 [Pseudoalteromonas luteoviolacea]AOT11902.1 hypothetical protein S40542_03420 [Pseudoalteromonas luteoviolacea]AOT16814.1 hypothetical protein S4054_03420 [Pseudoalteromonas luteoviolacea]KKE85664.1 hypothetical protein N479_25230 [Pseudoalteromonas luteoviolacea S4054]KZN78425.1 hypothetical protein N481_26105 [Pseudoalteromonas luteoviolacea S4047-1]
MRYTLIVICCFLFGCSHTNHSIQATLYKETSTDSDTYDFIQFSGNPIFVDSNSVFEVRIEEIMPGWIHQGVVQNAPLEQHNQNPDCDDSDDSDDSDDGPCFYNSWDDNIADQLYGKELWIVSKIESINKNDILERNSKVYFNATNVKLNSFSFKPIPLDIEELNLFSHSSDSAYRLTIKVYEVQGFNIKKEALKAYDNNPGISGLLISGWEVIKNTFGALVGEVIENQWKERKEEEQFIERLLLENGAVIEFQGVMQILRKKDELRKTGPVGKIEQYLLYDPYKSADFNSSFSSINTYQAALAELEKTVDLNIKNVKRTYLKFTVQQSLEVVPPLAVIPLEGQTEAIKFLKRVKRD